MNHFDEMTIMLHLDGQLDSARSAELSSHTRQCSECHALLTVLERESRLLGHALVEENEPVPTRLLEPPSSDSLPWGWMSAFGFVTVAAYTLWTGIIEPWRQNLTQAGFGGESLLTMLFFRGVFWKGWESVQNLAQISAIAILGIAAIFLIRRSVRRFSSFAVVMSLLAALFFLPSAASAAEVRKGKQIMTVPASETVKTDLIIAGGTIRIDGTIEGDLIAFGQSVTVNGRVTGDLIAFSQKVTITGDIDGNARIACNYLSLSGKVARNVMVFGENAEFDSKSSVGGGVILFSNLASFDGPISRDVLAFFKRGAFNNFVGGNLQLKGDSLEIGSSAVFEGKTSFKGNKEPDVNPAAKLASPLEFSKITRIPKYLNPKFYLRQFLQLAGAFLVGLLLFTLLPRLFSSVVRACGNIGTSLLLGLGGFLIACVLVGVAVVLIFFGVFAGVALAALALPACYLAQVFVGAWLGQKILGVGSGTGQFLSRLLVGLFLIRIVGMLPYVGGVLWLAVTLLGLGALLLALYRSAKQEEVAPYPATA